MVNLMTLLITRVCGTPNNRMKKVKVTEFWYFQHERISFLQPPWEAAALEWSAVSLLCKVLDLTLTLVLCTVDHIF
jgi:hypothetical protein